MTRRSVLTATAFAVLLGACQTTHTVQESTGPSLFVKSGMTGETFMEHTNSCIESSRTAKAAGSGGGFYYDGSGGLIGLFVVAAVAGAVEGARNANARDEAYVRCMKGAGYDLMPISSEVFSSYRSADEDEDRIQVVNDFIASPDFQQVNAWSVAKQVNTETGYRDFLAAYPYTDFYDQASDRLQQAVETRARVAGISKFSLWDKQRLMLRAISEKGWLEKADVRGTACSKRLRSDFRMVIRDGWAQGYLQMEDIAEPVVFLGRMDDDGRLELRTDWPADEPMALNVRVDGSEDLTGNLVSISQERCDQFVWLEQSETDTSAEAQATLDLNEWIGSQALTTSEIEAGFTALPALGQNIQTSKTLD